MRVSVLIAVTHLLGAGHLTRAAAIARALAAAGHDVTLVSGGMPNPLVPLDGVRLVQLPPVRATVDDFTALLDERGRPITSNDRAARRDRLVQAFEAARPGVVVTELYPFGRRVLADEFEALIGAAGSTHPRPLLLSSIRDILVAPTKPGRAEATDGVVERAFDAVLVHGDPDIIPLDASWPVGDALRRKLVYTGYVDAQPGPARPIDQVPRDGSIVVSGGSSAAALPLCEAALAAAALDPSRRWRILVGGGVDEAIFAGLRERAPPNATVERARPDFRDLLRRSSVFVGQAGYNTVMDLVATRIAAVLVPFEGGRETEQRLRAEMLARSGVASCLPEQDLSARALADSVAEALARPASLPLEMVRDGASETVRIVEGLVRAGKGVAVAQRSAAPS